MHSGNNATPAPAPPTTFTLGYRPSFDGIRGVGVLLIMGAHSFIAGLTAAGILALQSFFVLSGFLITVLLVREFDRNGRIDLKNFYARRALRLLPAFLLFLGVFTVLVAFTFPDFLRMQHNRAALAALFYFHNWAFIYGWVNQATVIGHCWSLSVEEQFYLIWPVALILLLRLPVSRATMIGIVAMGSVASMVERVVLLRLAGPSWRVTLGSDMHADALLLGCALGLAACWGFLPQRRGLLRVIKSCAFVSLVFLAWHSVRMVRWDPTFFGTLELSGGQGLRVAGLGLMFLTLLTSPPKLAIRLLEAPLIVWFGRRSYSIYLWHLGINAYCLIKFPELGQLWIAVVGAILSVSIAAASFRWVETPFLRMKTRFTAEPSAALTVQAQTETDDAPVPVKTSA